MLKQQHIVCKLYKSKFNSIHGVMVTVDSVFGYDTVPNMQFFGDTVAGGGGTSTMLHE